MAHIKAPPRPPRSGLDKPPGMGCCFGGLLKVAATIYHIIGVCGKMPEAIQTVLVVLKNRREIL